MIQVIAAAKGEWAHSWYWLRVSSVSWPMAATQDKGDMRCDHLNSGTGKKIVPLVRVGAFLTQACFPGHPLRRQVQKTLDAEEECLGFQEN